MPIETGTRFDRYQILAPLGVGGMGEVYLALDTRLGRKVALKLLPEKYTKDPKRLRRFEQEARAASALNHPNIITIHEIGAVDGVHFIATEFIEGVTLRRRLTRERLSIRAALDTAIQVANALVAAHAAGIVHRDIKPENVMVRPDGYVKVLDFGLAKLLEQAAPPLFEPETRTTSEFVKAETQTGLVNQVTVNSDNVNSDNVNSNNINLDNVNSETVNPATVEQATDNGETNLPAPPDLSRSPSLSLSLSAGHTQMDTAEPLSDDGSETLADTPPGQTLPGLVLGTPHYMSPEQARGLRVDTRTDVFSLGVVLYEMLTGQMPFEGRSGKQIMAAILAEEPVPIARRRAETPDLLEWIVAKALLKEREERYQTAREMLTDLKRLQQRLELDAELARSRRGLTDSDEIEGEVRRSSGSQAVAIGARDSSDATDGRSGDEHAAPVAALPPARGLAKLRRQRPVLTWLSAAALFLAAGYLIYNAVISRRSALFPFQQMKVARFTDSGRALRAALAPNGDYVVYASGDTRRQSLSVQQVTAAGVIEIVPPAEAVYRGLTFSPESDRIYYVVQEGNNPIQALYQVPVLGGAPRKLLEDIDSPVTFAPEGKRLAFVRRVRGRQDELIVADSNGGAQQVLAVRKGSEFFYTSGPAWSPDGKTIICPAGSSEGGRHMFYVAVNVADGTMRKIADLRWTNAGRPAWLPDGRGLIVSGIEAGATQAQVWQITYPQGKAQRIINDLNDYRDLSLTADARALITVKTEAQVNVWVAPAGELRQAKQITAGVGQYNGVRGLAWAPDGRLVYVSRRSGSQDIWIMNSDGTKPRQLTTPETRADVYPAVAPDGQSIVFVSTRSGSSNLYRMALDGTNQTQLTNGPGEEFPVVASDSQSVIYTATGSTMFTLWRVPLAGGVPTQLTERLSQWPVMSPDGKWIACWYREEAKQPWRLALFAASGPVAGGAPARLLNLPATADSAVPVRWLPQPGPADGAAISFVDNRNGVPNLWSFALESGELKQLTEFSGEQIFWFDWSREGKQLAVSRGTLINDVVLFSMPKP